jgi:TPR repeat protein
MFRAAPAFIAFALCASLAAQSGSRADQLFETGKRYYLARDYSNAYGYFMQAAQLGHVKAEVQVGYQHEKAQGVPRNDRESAAWYYKAAQAGDDVAQANLAHMYEDGTGVPQSDKQSFYWYNLSVHMGDYGRAFYQLARCYELGIGVQSDRQRAIELYQQAARLRYPGAAQAAYWLSFVGNVSFRDEKEQALWFAYQNASMSLAGCHGRLTDWEIHGGRRPDCSTQGLQAQRDALWERLPDHLKDP